MDHLDTQITELLRTNARAPYGLIGRQIGLSTSAVKRRVDKLRAEGVLRFTVQIVEETDQPRIEAFVELMCRGNVSTAELRTLVRDLPEVVEAYTVTGPSDADVRVVVSDIGSLERTLEALRATGQIERTRSEVILSTLVTV